jgi:LuxR family transcriptional regulator, maltose regulon positive regulatory protein
MPKSPAHLLRWSEENQVYELTSYGCTQQRLELEGGSSWSDFLATHTSFAFQGREGRLSLMKETRPRGAGYWYAYRVSDQHTSKQYLGRTSNVTIARLEEAARALSQTIADRQTNHLRAEIHEQPFTSRTLLLPKLQPPRLPTALVARPRLLQRLDAALERKLTLLVAPAGSGKTTLVNQWIHERQANGWSQSLAWVSLDSGDNDLLRFWRSTIAACQTVQPSLGQAALEHFAAALQPPFASLALETALTSLINDLTRQTQGGLLILDDYHTIENASIHEALTFFLDHLPATWSVLLLTRAEPLALPLLRWRARGDLYELYGSELCFSPEETATFVRQSFPIPLSAAVLKQLDESLQGWVAGLRLLALTFPAHEVRSGQATAQTIERALVSLSQPAEPSSPYQPLLDYFVTEIFATQPEQLQGFLLQTSVLTRLSGPLCEAVTGIEAGAVQLEAIGQAGLFLEKLDGGWYRFHALFAEAMRREAALRLGGETIRMLSLRASYWYEEHAMTAEAVEASLLARDFERAALLLENTNLDGQITELYTLQRWLEAIPEAVLGAHPMLCWLAALTLQVPQREKQLSPEARERVEVFLQMAETGARQQQQVELPGLIAALRAMDAWRHMSYASAFEQAHHALALLPRDGQANQIQGWRGMCLFIVGIGRMYEQGWRDARSAFLEAYTCSLTTEDRHFTCGLLVLLGVCCSMSGELYQAREHYQQALADARKQDDHEVIARSLLGLARISFAWHRLSLAEEQVNEALTFVPEEDASLCNEAALQLAELAYAHRRVSEARQQAEELLARLRITSSHEEAQLLPQVVLFMARLSLESGALQDAAQLLETLDLESMASKIFHARLLLAQGKPREAVLWLEGLLPDIQEWQQSIESQILLALACAACGESQPARQWLQQALSLAHGAGLLSLFLAEGKPLASQLRQLLPTLPEPGLRSHAQTILRTFAQPDEMPTANTSSMSVLVEPLSAQEQRVLRLLAAGWSNQEIARELVISINTVKDHAKHLYRKLGVSNRVQAGEVARQLKLI